MAFESPEPGAFVSVIVDGLSRGVKAIAVRKAKTVGPANIRDQAQLSYTARLKVSGVTVTVAVCVAARRDVKAAVCPGVDRVLASVVWSV